MVGVVALKVMECEGCGDNDVGRKVETKAVVVVVAMTIDRGSGGGCGNCGFFC